MQTVRLLNLQSRDYRGNLNGLCDLGRVVKIKREDIGSERNTRNNTCQCNIPRKYVCTCRELAPTEEKYFSFPKQVYRYSDWRYTDIGVGSVKALPRKRIRKIYLPLTTDRAVGSADLSPYIRRRSRKRWGSSYYVNKRTSSKCVGGIIENDNISLLSKKLSPIIQKKSGTTSPKHGPLKEKNVAAVISTHIYTNESNMNCQSQKQTGNIKIKSSNVSSLTVQADVTATRDLLPTGVGKLKSAVIVNNSDNCKDFSSDSFVQHVHNLENPSDDKHSKISFDPMENKLEREYRKNFTSKSKDRPSIDRPIPEFKSASLLRRRFEALRRGMCKKESKKESVVINIPLSHGSVPSRRDVSIASDPPSLEGRSYSNTKISNPFPKTADDYKANKKSSHGIGQKDKKTKDNLQWSTNLAENEGVQGMFKLWGKEFNFDEKHIKNLPKISNEMSRNPKEVVKSRYLSQEEVPKKKQGRKFFFFRNKNKEKEIKLFKPKKGVTAGRCEVKNGLMIKVGDGNELPKKEQVQICEKRKEQCEGLLRRAWLEKFITSAEDSRNNVHIRWNNNMYAASSSTVFELMDSVYKHIRIDLRSRSETTTNDSSHYRSFTKQRVHFMQQDIEAWMIPKMITDMQKRTVKNVGYSHEKCTKHIPLKIPSRRWFVDASKGFSQKVEVVLHAKPNSNSSEYVIISIPDGYFSHTNSIELRLQSSDEKIYKIIEYETPNLKKVIEKCHMATGDSVTHNQNVTKDNNFTVNVRNDDHGRSNVSATVSKIPPSIQASNISLPKRCDVIGVGIITQRDKKNGRQPILKVDDDLSEDDSDNNIHVQRKCELAESYIQDYCRSWMPFGIDLSSWHGSYSQLHSSGNNSITSLSQGDGSKSCPKMYDDFQESTIVLSSCETSSCSHCIALEEERKQEDSFKCKILNKFKRNSLSEAPLKSDQRHFAKDSLEVFKKRQLYACTNQKSKWRGADILGKLSKEALKTSDVCPKSTKPCWRLPGVKEKNMKKKRVSLPGCEAMGKLVTKLSDKSLEGILSYKGFGGSQNISHPHKRTEVLPEPVCQIPQPPCKESCVTEKKPPCIKKNAPPCDDLFQKLASTESSPPCERPQQPAYSPPVCVKSKQTKSSSPCRRPSILRETRDKNIQMSKTPSQESELSFRMSPKPSPKGSKECLHKRKKTKDCKPNCANRKRMLKKLLTPPPVPPPSAYHRPLTPPTDCSDSNKHKMSGLFLKKMPSKKNSYSNDCLNCDNDGPGIIRLNSQEKITIRMKTETPSTEEIREALNIKVQDQDGQTLYERIDYKQSGDVNKCVLLQDMYKGHHIQRVSTPTVQEVIAQKTASEVYQKKSDTSIHNMIEINFTLKLKLGDKGTKVDIQNDGDTEIRKDLLQDTESQKEIYVVQDRAEHVNVPESKKDVIIKIVIQNYNIDPDKTNKIETKAMQKTSNDNFAKRISEKFQTVSTGYSDVIDHQTFSIHRATVNMTNSGNICEVQNTPKCVSSIKSIENGPGQLIQSCQSVTELSVTEEMVNSMKHGNKDQNSVEHSKDSHEETDEFYGSSKEDNKSKHNNNKYPDEIFDEISDESILHKKNRLRNKAQKKDMLKRLFNSSSVVKRPENKRKIKDIIRAILTSDSSATEDIKVTSNELLKELAHGSLGQNCFRDTDSMNNYYQLDSDLSICKTKYNKLYPSKDDSECSAHGIDVSSRSGVLQGCLCSTLATKLDLSANGGSKAACCCRKEIKTDQEINCDVLTGDSFLYVKTCIDAETQNSKHVSNKVNSANLSVRKRTRSIVITDASLTVDENIDKDNVAPADVCFQTVHPDYGRAKCCDRRSFNRKYVSGISDDEMVVLNSNVVKKSVSKRYRKIISERADPANVLQTTETKKAVLEIYAKKIISDEGATRLVAKLPKFDLDTERDIFNYGGLLKNRKRVSKRNIVMMSVNR